MQLIAPGEFQVTDQEVITLTATASGTQFGVSYAIFGRHGGLQQDQPLPITMEKNSAEGVSRIPNARSALMNLVFNWLGEGNGHYDLKMTGSNGGEFDDSVDQADETPKAVPYIFHIL